MKKLSALFLVFVLCSCVYAGNNDVFPERNEFIELFNSYPIDFYDETPEALVKTEYITENNFKNNVVLTAFTGFTVVDTKTYRRDFTAAISETECQRRTELWLGAGGIRQKSKRCARWGWLLLTMWNMFWFRPSLRILWLWSTKKESSTTASDRSATSAWCFWIRILCRIRPICGFSR